MKRMIVLALFVVMNLVTGCSFTSPVLTELSTSKEPNKYPAEVVLDYYVANDTKRMYGKDSYIAVNNVVTAKVDYFEVHPVKKVKDEYIIIGTKYEDYSIRHPEKFGYQIIQMETKNGQIVLNVPNKKAYQSLNDGMIGWFEVCDYYTCRN